MNIIFLFDYPIIPYRGGVERVTYLLGEELRKRGYVVYYYCSNTSNIIASDILSNYQIYAPESHTLQERKLYFSRFIRNNSIRVIINQTMVQNSIDLLKNVPDNIKIVTCCHIQPFCIQGKADFILPYSRVKGWKGWIYNWFCRIFHSYYYRKNRILEAQAFTIALEVSDYLCLLSQHFIERLNRYMSVTKPEKLIAIPNPCVIRNVEESERERLIIWVGRQSNAEKNIPAFIDIWNEIHRSRQDWRALIIGDGPDIEYNRLYAKKVGAKNIDFVGSVSNVEEYYQRAAFIGLTSTCEGWGMVLVEAMSYGCIPFCYDTYESLRDIIDDGLNGLISPPHDFTRIARKVVKVIDDESLFLKMSHNAKQKAKAFSVETIVNLWESVLKVS